MNSGTAPLPSQCWVPPVRAPGQDFHLRSHTSCPAYLRSRLRNDSRVNPSGLECPYAGRDHTLLRGPVESKQYTSFDYGQELNDARVLASMGSVGDAYDNPSKTY